MNGRIIVGCVAMAGVVALGIWLWPSATRNQDNAGVSEPKYKVEQLPNPSGSGNQVPVRMIAPPTRIDPGKAAKALAKAVAKAATKRAAIPVSAVEERIARALEAIAAGLPSASERPSTADDLKAAEAFVWQPNGHLVPVQHVSRVDLGLLKGVDRMRDILIENTERFAKGLPANNALLWGARGMGKSSLVKAAHASVNKMVNGRLKLIEIH